MRPTVLLVTTCRWMAPALLARALRNAGCAIAAVCPPNHPLHVTTAVSRIFPFDAFRPLQAFRRAIEAVSPDLVIPCDDLAATTLHRLHAAAGIDDGTELRAILERSLGPSTAYALLESRSRFLSAVREQGIAAPETTVIESLDALRVWLRSQEFPVVLKADGSSGGVGVKIVHNSADADRAFHALSAPPLAARAIKRAVCDADRTLLLPWLRRERRIVSAQPYVAGREVTCTAACWQGNVNAINVFEVLQVTEPRGPASAIRTIHSESISGAVEFAVERIARQFMLSGICGFDFIIENESGTAHLLEINARATQTSHLPLGAGNDLPAAMYRALTGQPADATVHARHEIIALFPQEWRRDPSSELITCGYHDVPWEEPELVRLGLGRVGKGAWQRVVTKLASLASNPSAGPSAVVERPNPFADPRA